MSLRDHFNPSLHRFADVPAIPDPFLTDHFKANHKGKGTAIVIDNVSYLALFGSYFFPKGGLGSWQCRAGWAGENDPQLVFRNAIARTRGKKGESDYTCIGNDITNVEAVRSSLKNQFDKNLVSNFTYQEQLLDYTFSHLGLGAEASVKHPVVMTEPVCNPSYCRSLMSELLFEGYNIPAVAYGVDALFSAYHHSTQRGQTLSDCLVISSGHQTTHILPVLGGQFDAQHCKRINLGGMNAVGYLQRLLQLKYPSLLPHLTLTRAQELTNSHCYIALDYAEELQRWAGGGGGGEGEGGRRVVQLPYIPAVASSLLAEGASSREEKEKARKQRAREQLIRLNQKKKEEKIASFEVHLDQLLSLSEEQETVDPEEFSLMLEEAGFDSPEGLEKEIETTRSDLENEQQKLAALLKRNTKEPSPDKDEKVSEDWLQSLKERRKELLDVKRSRQQRRQELGKRRSAASQNRMRIISQLAEEAPCKRSKKKDDTFGMDDEDWNVYRTISKSAGESDSEREDAELFEISKVLEKHDPTFTKPPFSPTDMAHHYQLTLGIERFRVPEVLFQPTMVGVDQSGITHTLEYILQTYPPEIQQRLVDNVFVTGGNTLFPFFPERLEVDLRAMRPYQSTFTVTAAGDMLLDGWRGASTWASTPKNKSCFVSRAEYQEIGREVFKEHTASNLSITPLTVS